MAHEFILLYENVNCDFAARLLTSTDLGVEKTNGVLTEILRVYKIEKHCPETKFRILFLDLDTKKISCDENIVINIAEGDDGNVSSVAWQYLNYVFEKEGEASKLYASITEVTKPIFQPESPDIEVTDAMIDAALEFWPQVVTPGEVRDITTSFLTKVYRAMKKAATKSTS